MDGREDGESDILLGRQMSHVVDGVGESGFEKSLEVGFRIGRNVEESVAVRSLGRDN